MRALSIKQEFSWRQTAGCGVVVGQSYPNVFWTNCWRPLIKVCYSKWPNESHLFLSTWLVVPSHIKSGFGYVSCFGQWDFSKCGTIRNLKSAHALEFAFPCCWQGIPSAPCEKHRLASQDESPMGERGPAAPVDPTKLSYPRAEMSPGQLIHLQMNEKKYYFF